MKTISYILLFSFILSSCSFIFNKTTSENKNIDKASVSENLSDEDFQKLIEEGEKYLNNMQLDEAAKIFLRVIQINPDTVVGYYGLGVTKAIICHQTGMQCHEAIEFMKKTLYIEPNYRKASFNIGTCYTKLGKFETSLEFFDKAIKYDSTNGEYFCNRGFSKLKMNKTIEACKDFHKANSLGADKAKIYLKKCE